MAGSQVTPTVWAISDTHLSFASPKDQSQFGPKWVNHAERIRSAWLSRIADDDIVLLPGDLSWAHNPRNVRLDLEWIAALPGRKVLVRGNHDYWWKKLGQVHDLLPDSISAIQGTSLALDGVILCGTMGHIAPNDPYYESRKFSSYQRELKWLSQALDEARALRSNGQPIILLMHYPPFTSDGQPSGFSERIQAFAPDVCVYGHLHFSHEWNVAANGLRDGTRYHLVACDFLDMTPRQVWPPCEP